MIPDARSSFARELNGAAAPARLSLFPFPARTGRIIVASSEAQKRQQLRAALEFQGYVVAETGTADQTLQETYSGLHDSLILDSGFEEWKPHELCRGIRLKSDLGIIVLADADTRQGRIDALNAGADDYVPSPFVLRELLARVRAVLRRMPRLDLAGPRIILQDRAIDLNSHEVRGPGNRVSHLTPKEFLVLQCLVAHANKSFTHQNLAQTIWQRDGVGEVEYVRIVIRQLRRKLEPDPHKPRYIVTERGVGYRFHTPHNEQDAIVGLSPQLSLAS